jgi:hypothetical protein
MKNKLFLAGIIFILIFGIIGMGCDGGGGSIDGGGSGGGGSNSSGGSGNSGGGNGGDMSDGSGSGNGGDDGYDGSGSGDNGGNDGYDGSSIIIIGGSGSGKSRSYYTVKFTVTSSDESGSPVKGIPVIIKYSYPNNKFNYNTPYSPISHTVSKNTPWDTSVAISSKVIGNGVYLNASIDTSRDISGDASQKIKLTVKIFVDGKERASNSEWGSVSVNW